MKKLATNLKRNVRSMLAESCISFKFDRSKCKRGIELTDVIEKMFRLRMLIRK